MLNRSTASHRRLALPRIAPVAGACALVATVALCAFSPGRAHANIIITPTFDSSITNDSQAASIEGGINAAIGVLEADISTPITVPVYFQEEVGTGNSGSNTSFDYLNYYSSSTMYDDSYYTHLKAVDTAPGATSAQRTALASLGTAPTDTNPGNPVNGLGGSASLLITTPNARALGFDAPPNEMATNGQLYDSVIDIDPTSTFPPNSNNGKTNSLKAEVMHELDEVLGSGGAGSQLSDSDYNQDYNGSSAFPSQGPVGPMDLFRYSAAGTRSFSLLQTASPYSYFSIDGGKTVLSYFNQNGHGETGDYGDWLSDPIPAGYLPQVQDAFISPGEDPALGVNELTALNVIGYTLAVPEPSTMGIAFCGIFSLLLRRRSSPTAG